ncbi:MAG: hypothetical protein A07HR60_01896 [uncultured archaeon A07HR60]|nr:MAG: hypothetical protein A07HR60_01896 [uncultured archaeon A07HR60]
MSVRARSEKWAYQLTLVSISWSVSRAASTARPDIVCWFPRGEYAGRSSPGVCLIAEHLAHHGVHLHELLFGDFLVEFIGD